MTDDRMTMDARAQAVEAMARAILDDWAERSGVSFVDADDLEDTRAAARVALNALLSSGLAVLMGELEGVYLPHIPESQIVRIRSREEEGT